jgi:hypothetical protein
MFGREAVEGQQHHAACRPHDRGDQPESSKGPRQTARDGVMDGNETPKHEDEGHQQRDVERYPDAAVGNDPRGLGRMGGPGRGGMDQVPD